MALIIIINCSSGNYVNFSNSKNLTQMIIKIRSLIIEVEIHILLIFYLFFFLSWFIMGYCSIVQVRNLINRSILMGLSLNEQDSLFIF